MKKLRNKLKIFFFIHSIILLTAIAFLSPAQSDFSLPHQGGGMVHCDPQMSENIRLPVPTTNVGMVWYRHDLGGELFGSQGNGIAGNGKIAACTFNNPFGIDNLILYDYNGHHLWSSGGLLNVFACTSSPMVDIHNRVIACDNYKIILINASNFSNIHVEWTSNITHNGSFFFPIPISPTIVENKTIILPTVGGPVFAFDVETGEEIANIILGENVTIDPYWGIPEMNYTNYLSIMNDYVISSICPYRHNSTTHLIEWNSSVPYGIMPIKNNIFLDDNMAYYASENNVTVYEKKGLLNWTILASNNIKSGGFVTGAGYFSTINSACVKGKRVFLATEYKKPGTWSFFNNTIGRMFAIDVNIDATNKSDRLKEAWNYTYFGESQASPTLIDDTLYFDGYNNTLIAQQRDPHIYAVYTNGTEKWRISYPNITWFTFTMDPRGGFWYEDCDQVFRINTGGNKLVRFYEENGTIWEELDMKTLLNDTGSNKELPVIPSSDMTICGTSINPIMLISANHPHFNEGKWVLTINLSNNNTVIWKIPINSTFHRNYAGGGFTILNESFEYRILFCTNVGGVMALGTVPPSDLTIFIIICVIFIVIIAFILWFVFLKKKRSL